MTKEEKQLRKYRRCEKRRKRKVDNETIRRYMSKGLTVGQAMSFYRRGYFYENGERKRICEYRGLCSYPCNGDC